MATEIQDNFSEFYKRHFQSVYRICYIFMQNSADAEDCTEDTFVKAITSKQVFNDEHHERAWLTVTAKNICRDKLKNWWNKKTEPLEAYEETLPAKETPSDSVLEAVMALPDKYKDIVFLYYYEGYQTDEIARMLRRPHSTVRNQLRDARGKLKNILEDRI